MLQILIELVRQNRIVEATQLVIELRGLTKEANIMIDKIHSLVESLKKGETNV